jgi:hypothetical protein
MVSEQATVKKRLAGTAQRVNDAMAGMMLLLACLAPNTGVPTAATIALGISAGATAVVLLALALGSWRTRAPGWLSFGAELLGAALVGLEGVNKQLAGKHYLHFAYYAAALILAIVATLAHTRER